MKTEMSCHRWVKTCRHWGLRVTLLHLLINLSDQLLSKSMKKNMLSLQVSLSDKIPFFCLGYLSSDAFQCKFNKGLHETGYFMCSGREAPWGCFTQEESLIQELGSHPHGLSYTRPLWPQTHGAKCKSDNVDNCPLKIMECWLRSMTFPNREVVCWMKSRLKCGEALNNRCPDVMEMPDWPAMCTL